MNFGCGPTVHCNISASAVFKEIICAEYAEANRKELEKWLSNDDDKFDWSVFFKYVAVPSRGKKVATYSCLTINLTPQDSILQ